MSLIKEKKQIFNTLSSDFNGNYIEPLNFDEICDYTEQVAKNFKSFLVRNEKGKPHFKVDEEFRIIYMTDKGDVRCADITEYAFSQLCTCLGLPASYVKKCFENGKEKLALANFRAWSGDIEKNLVFKEYQGVIRGVVSEHYKGFSGARVCETLRRSVDLNRYMAVQANVQPDSLAIRFVEKDEIHIEGDKSPLWNGFMVTNNDVGGGALKITDFLYRQWCTNGMTTPIFSGAALRKNHNANDMQDGKILIFSKTIEKISTLKDEKIKLINKAKGKTLNLDEYKMFTDKISSNLRLSEQATEDLKRIIVNEYSQDGRTTNWSVINGITQLGRDMNLDKRLEMEKYAGNILVAR